MKIEVTVHETVTQVKKVTVDAYLGDDIEELARHAALNSAGEWETVDSGGFEYIFDEPKELPRRPEHTTWLAEFARIHEDKTGIVFDEGEGDDVIEQYYGADVSPAQAVDADIEKHGLEVISDGD